MPARSTDDVTSIANGVGYRGAGDGVLSVNRLLCYGIMLIG